MHIAIDLDNAHTDGYTYCNFVTTAQVYRPEDFVNTNEWEVVDHMYTLTKGVRYLQCKLKLI